MATFADYFTLKLGEVTVKGRRLTLREIQECRADSADEFPSAERCIEIVRSHVTLENGDEIDPHDLTPDQLRKVVAELILPKEGRGIADFIGLLS